MYHSMMCIYVEPNKWLHMSQKKEYKKLSKQLYLVEEVLTFKWKIHTLLVVYILVHPQTRNNNVYQAFVLTIYEVNSKDD